MKKMIAKDRGFTAVEIRSERSPDGTSYRAVKAATTTGDIEVWIDVDKLVAYYGRRALLAKSRQSKQAKGGVILVAVNVHRREEPVREAA